jgi:anhydro-N-acetylmuramic acid kinase
MRTLEQAVHPVRVLTSDEIGLPAEAKESIAFAVLAYETWHNRPGNLPSATGAGRPVVLGSITPGKNFSKLLSQPEDLRAQGNGHRAL